MRDHRSPTIVVGAFRLIPERLGPPVRGLFSEACCSRIPCSQRSRVQAPTSDSGATARDFAGLATGGRRDMAVSVAAVSGRFVRQHPCRIRESAGELF